jgi:hypothetical protein
MALLSRSEARIASVEIPSRSVEALGELAQPSAPRRGCPAVAAPGHAAWLAPVEVSCGKRRAGRRARPPSGQHLGTPTAQPPPSAGKRPAPRTWTIRCDLTATLSTTPPGRRPGKMVMTRQRRAGHRGPCRSLMDRSVPDPCPALPRRLPSLLAGARRPGIDPGTPDESHGRRPMKRAGAARDPGDDY